MFTRHNFPLTVKPPFHKLPHTKIQSQCGAVGSTPTLVKPPGGLREPAGQGSREIEVPVLALLLFLFPELFFFFV